MPEKFPNRRDIAEQWTLRSGSRLFVLDEAADDDSLTVGRYHDRIGGPNRYRVSGNPGGYGNRSRGINGGDLGLKYHLHHAVGRYVGRHFQNHAYIRVADGVYGDTGRRISRAGYLR